MQTFALPKVVRATTPRALVCTNPTNPIVCACVCVRRRAHSVHRDPCAIGRTAIRLILAVKNPEGSERILEELLLRVSAVADNCGKHLSMEHAAASVFSSGVGRCGFPLANRSWLWQPY